MRVPQRNFVVEFKSRSRQTKTSKPPSIWGDTDLKAVARQVEEQAADLFEQREETATLPLAELEKSLSDINAPEYQPAPVEAEPQLSEFKKTASAQIHPTSTITVDTALPRTAEQPSTAPKTQNASRTKVRKTSPRARRAQHVVPPEGKEETAYVSRADLAALETENMRLKAMLREQLIATNRRLKAMLQRFS